MNMTAAGTAAGGGRAGIRKRGKSGRRGRRGRVQAGSRSGAARTAGPGMGLGWGGCGPVGGWSLLVAAGREGRRRHALGGAPRAQGRAGRRKEPVRPARGEDGTPEGGRRRHTLGLIELSAASLLWQDRHRVTAGVTHR